MRFRAILYCGENRAKEGQGALGLDALTFGFTGAAPISKETLQFFGVLGIQINEVYGMSECAGATTCSIDQAHVWGLRIHNGTIFSFLSLISHLLTYVLHTARNRSENLSKI